MDFNDIQNRLERIYTSINSRFDADIAKHADLTIASTSTSHTFSISFDKDKTSNQEKIMHIIHNIANLRDHLKNNIDEIKVNQHFHSDINLKIIMDLSNADKHGYPTNTNHSKLNPKIDNVTSIPQGNFIIGYLFDGTSTPKLQEGAGPIIQGDSKIVIDADIMDDQGNKICILSDLVEKSMLSWETFMKKHNLI